jgi:hypothetical protein
LIRRPQAEARTAESLMCGADLAGGFIFIITDFMRQSSSSLSLRQDQRKTKKANIYLWLLRYDLIIL